MGECKNCRFKNKTYLDHPCSTGSYQMLYSNKCFMWKKERWWKKVFNYIIKK
nr:hypothetical protein [Clostridium botulinum]